MDTKQYRLLDPAIYAPWMLDSKGRCCGRKPLVYKRDGGPHRFCVRCDRAYPLDDDVQIANWAWRATDEGFQSTKKRIVERECAA